jgi:hypothetical protein
MKKTLLLLALACALGGAQAQSSPAKKDLVAKILKIQQPGIEALARSIAEDPASALIQRADQYMQQRVPAEKRPGIGKEIDTHVKRYLDESVPLLRDRAVKLAPSSVGALLEEKFSEDELKQVLAFLESPAYVKFQQLGPDMQKALLDKILTDARPQMEPKVQALEQNIAKSLGVTPQPAAAAPAAKPAAKPSSR